MPRKRGKQNNTIYIYAYENKVNGKMYIGQTVDLVDRDCGHKNFKGQRSAIDAAIRLYGRDKFDLFTVEIVDTKEKANTAEIFWIAEMRRVMGRENVYNIADGGGGQAPKGSSLKGEEHPNFGKTMPLEVRQKISNSLKAEKHPFFGKKLPEEHSKNIALAKMGDKNPNFGKHPSLETLAKKSAASSGENNGNAKLTSDDVIEIRRLLSSKVKATEVSVMFNVSYQIIGDIKRRKTWKHLK